MTDCMNAEVRDALPDLMNGRLSDIDKATMTAHVESCADCREELRLLQEIKASAPMAPRMDVSRIVAALPAAMPATIDHLVDRAPARARPRSSMVWKAMAAAALLVTGTLTFATSRHQAVGISPSASGAAVSSAAAPQAAKTGMSGEATGAAVATAVPAVVAAAARPVAGARTELSLTGGVQDLGDEQLQSLLNDLENVQGLPAAEPEAVTISVDDHEGLQ